jgi:putative phage-type endonuclease
MTTYIFDLEPLDDIINKLVFEEEPTIFTEEYAIELVETALQLMENFMEDNPTAISDPDFHEIILEEIKDIFYTQMEHHILDSDYVEDDMNDLLEYAFKIFVTTFYTERSNFDKEQFLEMDEIDVNILNKKIQKLREIPQPLQRTPEWYKFRWNLITASNAWKAFESQSTINQLIYEKCQPLKDFTVENVVKMVNTNSPLHWGQKYEPLSIMLYEDMYNSKVEDFGCIQHPNYSFIGASPDGIIVESHSGRYGRMLEIKNIVNREITGIPKKEYWIQMQLQMEVCDLNECDFLETKFIEYLTAQDFIDDTYIDENICDMDLNLSKDKKQKGIILYFHTKERTPFYEYKPLNIVTKDDMRLWEESELDKYESEPYNYTFMKFIYWKIEKLNCVLVLRNNDWFKNNVRQLEKVWKTIEEERVTGYNHRAPNKKNKNEQQMKSYVNINKEETCFLKVVKMNS